MSIGERIVNLRKEQNISQIQLADVLGVTRQAISKWENDLSNPDTLNLIKLADLLNTDVEYLATGRIAAPLPAPAPEIVKQIETVEKIVEVEKVVKVPETVTVERIVHVPQIVEKPVTKIKYRTQYVRNPLEFLLVGTVFLFIGILLGLVF